MFENKAIISIQNHISLSLEHLHFLWQWIASFNKSNYISNHEIQRKCFINCNAERLKLSQSLKDKQKTSKNK